MVSGKVPSNSLQVFTLEGGAGAPLGLYLMSAESNGAFEVTGPSGEIFAKSSPDKFGAQQWKGTLGQGGTYTVVVYSLRGLADFQLTVEMP